MATKPTIGLVDNLLDDANEIRTDLYALSTEQANFITVALHELVKALNVSKAVREALADDDDEHPGGGEMYGKLAQIREAPSIRRARAREPQREAVAA